MHIPMPHELLISESLISLLLFMFCNDLCRSEVYWLGYSLRDNKFEMSNLLFQIRNSLKRSND